MTPALRGLKDPQTRKLAEVLDTYTRPGELGKTLEEERVRCVACGHRCVILPGHRGICRVRYNEGGTLYVPWGYVAALQNDPVEKKPFYHVLPGAYALTFGMLGCDFHCSFCQNWVTSQALRDPHAVARIYEVTPEDLVRMAEEAGSRLVISSYNEPLITAEWAHAVFAEARRRGFVTGFVSNGNATEEVLVYLRPVMDLMKVDLKTMNPRRYRELGGVLDHVLETIGRAHAMGFWVEVVTLVIPGWNDDPEEIRAAARWIRDVDPTPSAPPSRVLPANFWGNARGSKRWRVGQREIRPVCFGWSGNRHAQRPEKEHQGIGVMEAHHEEVHAAPYRPDPQTDLEQKKGKENPHFPTVPAAQQQKRHQHESIGHKAMGQVNVEPGVL
ncbi:MAG: radical SAM protein [Candidatus Hydrothermae bacterium]|nr:radical SAM protein [Candidatus Hydrothermae bacterium]